MARSFNQYPKRGNVAEGCILSGCIITDTTTPTVKRGKGFTVAKQATGVYRVTWNRNAVLIGAGALLHKVADAEARFLAGAIYVQGNNYIDFRTEDATGAAANAAATDEISFMLDLQMVTGAPV